MNNNNNKGKNHKVNIILEQVTTTRMGVDV
jgi:hypothetical protein